MNRILTVPTTWYIKGIEPPFPTDLKPYLKERELAEGSHQYRQPVPYTIVAQYSGGLRFLSYKRKGGEKGLINQYSIGFGGHVEEQDLENMLDPIEAARWRELGEEIDIERSDVLFQAKLGTIVLSTNPVNLVHAGHVSMVFSTKAKFSAREKGITHVRFLTLGQLIDNYQSYENWSKIIIDHFRLHINNKLPLTFPSSMWWSDGKEGKGTR